MGRTDSNRQWTTYRILDATIDNPDLADPLNVGATGAAEGKGFILWGDTSAAKIEWNEDSDQLLTTSATIRMGTDDKLEFRDANHYIQSDAANDLMINAGTLLNLAIDGTDEVRVSGAALYPATDDGQTLGILASNEWSDLFLADGGVIGWSNNDVTLTHSAGLLTLSDSLTVTGDIAVPQGSYIYLEGNGGATYIRANNAGYLDLVTTTAVRIAQLLSLSGGLTVAGTLILPVGSIGTAYLRDNSVTTAKIANQNVTQPKLAPLAVATGNLAVQAVSEAKLKVNAVSTTRIVDLAVTTAKLNNNAVSQAKLGTDAVSTVKIVDQAVTTAKLSIRAVTEAKILDNAVTLSKIANGSVNSDKLSTNAVSSVKIQNLAVTGAKIAAATITSGKMAPLSISNGSLIDAAVSGAKIANLGVSVGKLATDSIVAGNIQGSAVTTTKIANGAVTTEKIANGAVDWTKTDGGSYSGLISGVTNIAVVNGLVTTIN